jgi:hypothetical protein
MVVDGCGSDGKEENMVQLSHYGNTVAIDGNSPIEDEY